MATSKLCTHLRRLRPSRFYSISFLSCPLPFRLHEAHTLSSSHHQPFTTPSHRFDPHISSVSALTAFSSRYFWTRSNDDSEFEQSVESRHLSNDDTGILQSGIQDLELGGVVEEVIGTTTVEDSILPIQQLTSILDGFHQYTGMPWWAVIASSTLALRFTLLPLLIVQLNKLKRIGELFPKLPPPLPPPLSRRSYIDQISLFRKERKAIGCPSFLWFPAYFFIQVEVTKLKNPIEKMKDTLFVEKKEENRVVDEEDPQKPVGNPFAVVRKGEEDDTTFLATYLVLQNFYLFFIPFLKDP